MSKEMCPWCGEYLEYKHYSLHDIYKRCTNEDCTYTLKVVKEDENNK